jgi:hypothetical protein
LILVAGAGLLERTRPDRLDAIIATPPGRLAYSIDGDAYLADEDGSNPEPIVGAPGGEWYEPVWSPDGGFVAFKAGPDPPRRRRERPRDLVGRGLLPGLGPDSRGSRA